MAAQTDLVLARFRRARRAPPRRPLPPRPPMSAEEAIDGLLACTAALMEPVFLEQFAALSREEGHDRTALSIAEMLAYARPVEEPGLETAADQEFRIACTISAVRHRQQTGHDAARVPGTFTVRCVECDRVWIPSLTAEEG